MIEQPTPTRPRPPPQNNLKSTIIRQRRKPTVEAAQHAVDDDRGAHIFRTV